MLVPQLHGSTHDALLLGCWTKRGLVDLAFRELHVILLYSVDGAQVYQGTEAAIGIAGKTPNIINILPPEYGAAFSLHMHTA